jgi:protoporphyrinogen oxidase
LRAKFGPFYDQIAAVFIWATLTRLFGARAAGSAQEKLGYCSGGYRRILGRVGEALAAQQVVVRTGAAVSAIRPAAGGGAEVVARPGGGELVERFDQVLFTAPTQVARKVVGPEFLPHVAAVEAEHPTAAAYLGVACLVLALRRPLTPYYVLNIGDETVELTGLIEMTNLIDRTAETAGLSLVYLPRYLASDDPMLDAPDAALADGMMSRGLRRLFPDVSDADIVYRGVHRARFVQPLPLVRSGRVEPGLLPRLSRPFQIVNTSMLTCATLNNNEVVGLVDRFLSLNRPELGRL